MAGEGKVDANGAPDSIRSTAIADYGTGLAIAWAATAALYHRERSGEGQMVETSLLATALAFQGGSVMELPPADSASRAPMMERVHELQAQGAPYAEIVAAHNPWGTLATGNIFYRAFTTEDGALAIGALSRGLRDKARIALESDWLGQDDPNANMMHAEFQRRAAEAVAKAEALLASKTTEQWMEIFDREGVPAGPVNFAEDMTDDTQVTENGLVVELDHELSGPQRMVAPILTFSKTRLQAQGASPPLGRDTDALLGGAGYSAEQIAELREAGVIA